MVFAGRGNFRGGRSRNLSVSDVWGWEALTPDGLAYVGQGRWSMTARIPDMHFALAPEEDRSALLDQYAALLNAHVDGAVQIQVVCGRDEGPGRFALALRGDGRDDLRQAANAHIGDLVLHGRDRTQARAYMTALVHAEDEQEARIALGRVLGDDEALVRKMGASHIEVLDGVGRGRLIESLISPGARPRFDFGQVGDPRATTRQVLSPISLEQVDPVTVRLETPAGGRWVRTVVMRRFPRFLSEHLMRDLASMQMDMVISTLLEPLDQAEGIELVARQMTFMDMQATQVREKAAARGMVEELPHSLQVAKSSAKSLLNELESSDEKLFSCLVQVTVCAGSKEELEECVGRIARVAAKHSAGVEPARFMQLAGLNGALPLGRCDIPIRRTVMTSVAAMLAPFTTQELDHAGGIVYGMNAISKNMVLGDRRRGRNQNAFILGTAGSGKSQMAKWEILNRGLMGGDQIIIVDPEREYVPVVDALGGEHVVISPSSDHGLNPLMLPKDVETSDAGSPVATKAASVGAMIDVLIGGPRGLSARDRGILDDVLMDMYQHYWDSPEAVSPTLAMVASTLRGGRGEHLGEALSMYATGSAAGLAAGESSARLSAPVVRIDIHELPAKLTDFAMMVILEEVWNQVARNRAAGRRTWVYIDEFHLLMHHAYAIEAIQALVKRARKWGAGITGITQNVEELLAHEEARLMLSNTSGLILMGQEATDRDTLTDLLRLSPQLSGYLETDAPGCGLMRLGGVWVPINNTMDPGNELFALFATNPATVREDAHAD